LVRELTVAAVKELRCQSGEDHFEVNWTKGVEEDLHFDV
jgi:hypothetical protein